MRVPVAVVGAVVVSLIVSQLGASTANAQDDPVDLCQISSTPDVDSTLYKEGFPTNPAHRPSVGTLRTVALYVYFPDARPVVSTNEMAERFEVAAYRLQSSSGGRLRLKTKSHPDWLLMPKKSTAYDISTYDGQKVLLADAAAAVEKEDADIDLSGYDTVHVVQTTAQTQETRSSTFTAEPGQGVPVRGGEITSAITYGTFDGQMDQIGNTVVHELGHVMGLPDLYDTSATSFADAHAHAGKWDMMGEAYGGPEFMVWHKWKLGGWTTTASDASRATGRRRSTSGSTELPVPPVRPWSSGPICTRRSSPSCAPGPATTWGSAPKA